MLVENGSLYADQAQDLINQELEKNEKLEQDMEHKKAAQMASFQEKLAQRKEERLRKLHEQQEIEKAQVLIEPVFLNLGVKFSILMVFFE